MHRNAKERFQKGKREQQDRWFWEATVLPGFPDREMLAS